mgnify:FL=1
MTMFHARSTWVHPAPPITGPAMPAWSAIDTIALHYPAGNTPDGDPGDTTDVAGYLRAVQTAYVRDRGYSIGYAFGFDHLGDVWELRGWDIKPAAVKGHNEHVLSFLLIVDQDAPCTAAQLEAVRAYVAETERRRGQPVHVVGHGDLAATGCPGAGVRQQIAAGLFRPITTTPEDPTMPATARRVRLRGTLDVFLIGAGPPVHLTPELDASYADVPMVTVAFHDQFAQGLFHQTGLTYKDLEGSWT